MSVDPSGREWEIDRRINRAKARACSSDPRADTIADLAKKIGLIGDQFREWLSDNQASNNLSLFLLPSDITKPVGELNIVKWVPNTIIAYWGGLHVSLLNSWGWNDDVNALEAKGYHVIVSGLTSIQGLFKEHPWSRRAPSEHILNSPLTAAQFGDMISEQTLSKTLNGVMFVGHGYQQMILLSAQYEDDVIFRPAYLYTYADWKNDQQYKLGLGILYACYSQSAADVFSPDAIFYGGPKCLNLNRRDPRIPFFGKRDRQGLITGITWNPSTVSEILAKYPNIK